DHLDEGKTAGAPRGLVTHHANVVDGTGPAEQLVQILVSGLVRKVTNIQSAAHGALCLNRARVSGCRDRARGPRHQESARTRAVRPEPTPTCLYLRGFRTSA